MPNPLYRRSAPDDVVEHLLWAARGAARTDSRWRAGIPEELAGARGPCRAHLARRLSAEPAGRRPARSRARLIPRPALRRSRRSATAIDAGRRVAINAHITKRRRAAQGVFGRGLVISERSEPDPRGRQIAQLHRGEAPLIIGHDRRNAPALPTAAARCARLITQAGMDADPSRSAVVDLEGDRIPGLGAVVCDGTMASIPA
jgi:hypothetical protein